MQTTLRAALLSFYYPSTGYYFSQFESINGECMSRLYFDLLKKYMPYKQWSCVCFGVITPKHEIELFSDDINNSSLS